MGVLSASKLEWVVQRKENIRPAHAESAFTLLSAVLAKAAHAKANTRSDREPSANLPVPATSTASIPGPRPIFPSWPGRLLPQDKEFAPCLRRSIPPPCIDLACWGFPARGILSDVSPVDRYCAGK